MQRLQPWGGWGGSFRGALPARGWVPTASTRSSGSRAQTGSAAEVPWAGVTRRRHQGLGREWGCVSHQRGGNCLPPHSSLALHSPAPWKPDPRDCVTPELTLRSCLSFHTLMSGSLGDTSGCCHGEKHLPRGWRPQTQPGLLGLSPCQKGSPHPPSHPQSPPTPSLLSYTPCPEHLATTGIPPFPTGSRPSFTRRNQKPVQSLRLCPR